MDTAERPKNMFEVIRCMIFGESVLLLSCGFISGIGQAAAFNPWDRALYLAAKSNRPFLNIENFRNPFTGMKQTILQRALGSGMYFPLEEIYRRNVETLYDHKKSSGSKWFINFLSGLLASCSLGLLMNPISSVKYHYWGTIDCGKENMLSTAVHMYQKGGIRPFFVGTSATVIREFLFGGIFGAARHELPLFLAPINRSDETNNNKLARRRHGGTGFLVDMASALLATLISSPLNFVRNMHFATPPHEKPKPIVLVLQNLWTDSAAAALSAEQTGGGSHIGWLRRAGYLARRCQVGWGTLRVGCGMALSSYIYSLCKSVIIHKTE